MTKDEALNILKELHDKAPLFEKGALEVFFPEFKEQDTQKHLKLEKGKWYLCIKDFQWKPDFTDCHQGEKYYCSREGVVQNFYFQHPEKYFCEYQNNAKDEIVHFIPEGYFAEIRNDAVVIKKEKPIKIKKRHLTGKAADLAKEVTPESLEETKKKMLEETEPKFKVGDWVVFNGFVLHIDEIVDGYYRTTTIGGIPNSYDWNIDNAARLWTIQDARDGDVLAEDSCIFIIRKLGDESTIAKTYCALFNDGDFYDSTMLCFDVDSTKPATEEQRELLFKKMAENGYAWDSEKKELKLVITNGGDFEPELSHKEVSHKEVTKKSEHDGKKWIDEKVYWKEREELFEDGKQEVINNPMKYGLIKLLTPTKSACVE